MKTKMSQQEIGVLLVDNCSSQVTDKEIYSFFSRIENVTSVNIILNVGDTDSNRYAWLDVKNTPETICKLNNSTLGGRKLHIRLMGYLYPES
jgi:hypothetical protein